MAFRKFKADQLFDGYRLLEDSPVLVTKEDGTIHEIVPVHEAGDDIQSLNGILSPGLVNCHCHLELSHMKGKIEEKTGLPDFVYRVVTERHLPEEQILDAIAAAEDEMLQNGTVAVGDICNNMLALSQKQKGRLYYHNFIEASGFSPSIADQRFERSLGFYREYEKNYQNPFQPNSIVPHASYSVANELWEKIIHFPGNNLMTIHNQETVAEDEWFIRKEGEFVDFFKRMNIDTGFFSPSGKSSLPTYLPKFLKSQQVILVHNVHTSASDLEFAKGTGQRLAWCFCPNANLYIGGQLPAVNLFTEREAHIVLGTDSLASNHQLSILEEARTIQKHFPEITRDQLLRWATSNGAKALQMDKLLGSFEPGKRPGVILIDTDLSRSRRLL
jgi:cytosine/adenosine deaminase-related metal-dependent hydrolase